jgi:hypothetical protein
MAAMITADISMGVKEEYKEYLEVGLKDKLKEGHLYNVAFYAVLCGRAKRKTFWQCATHGGE